MNSQNILKFYGSRLDIRLDSSEYYDYEISKTQGDYNTDVLDFSKSIIYPSLIIDDTLYNMYCVRSTITLTEINNTSNDPSYIYSGLTLTLNYQSFISQIGANYENTILNNDILTYTGITGETHYFKISGYNNNLNIDQKLFNYLTITPTPTPTPTTTTPHLTPTITSSAPAPTASSPILTPSVSNSPLPTQTLTSTPTPTVGGLNTIFVSYTTL
jgi:hypothetical protein